MKPKLLLFALLLASGLLNAQDTIRSLVISEVRLDDARHIYLELSNVGATPVNLSQFEIGVVGPWTSRYDVNDINKWFNVGDNWMMLPNKDLAPNKSFTLAAIWDWNEEQWLKDHSKGGKVYFKHEWLTLADMQMHAKESPVVDETDSVSLKGGMFVLYNGRDCFYLRHHLSNGDSVVVDQVNGIFDESDGTSRDATHDVAGYSRASQATTLVRKFSVKKGNIDFESGRGLDLQDSEWLPIPHLFGSWEQHRALFWTAGNHGDYNLDATTLTSSTVTIDWDNNTLLVPWGVRRDDSLMFQFDKHPGLAWHFDYAANHEDSAYYSVRTGDKLTVYACGNDLDVRTFTVTVAPPTAGANIVVQKKFADSETGYYSAWPPTWIITDKVPVMDTIMNLPAGIRSDTLLKYIEKAPNATWAFEWLGGAERADLKTGDILKVTAENGDVRKYYIKVEPILKSHNAYLASITWPDIPEFYKGIFGWIGDTIPNFVPGKYNYKIKVPYDVDGIPALVANLRILIQKLKL